MRLPTILLLLMTSLTVGCSCQRQPAQDAAATANGTAASSEATRATERRDQSVQVAATGQRELREQAMGEAVDTLHVYLGELGSGLHAQAEARWAYHRAPTVDEEAGLRTLAGLSALRIENGAPKPLDRESVPQSLEIPVSLRASLDDGSVRQYRGWYRLRRNPVEPKWELVGASLQPARR